MPIPNPAMTLRLPASRDRGLLCHTEYRLKPKTDREFAELYHTNSRNGIK